MPRICFQEKRFREQDAALIAYCDQILTEYAQKGYQMTVRQLYYQLVARNVIPNESRYYDKLVRLMTDGRMAGLINWDHITDLGRVPAQASMWSSAEQAMASCAANFRLNPWHRQENYVEVMVEKQALLGVVAKACTPLGVVYMANKGYSSTSALYEASTRYLAQVQCKKKVTVLYLGDHDPSGMDMTRDIRERLATFSGVEIDVKRISLNMSQVEQLGLPPNPARSTDSRYPAYAEEFGDESWELDAVPPDVLCGMITRSVMRRVDKVEWDAVMARQAMNRMTFRRLAGYVKEKDESIVEKPTNMMVRD